MRERLSKVPPVVIALAAIGLGVASGLIGSNAFGQWVRIMRAGTGPICSRPPCLSPGPIVSPAEFDAFRPNGDVGLAIGVAVAAIVVVAWAIARRKPAAKRDLSR